MLLASRIGKGWALKSVKQRPIIIQKCSSLMGSQLGPASLLLSSIINESKTEIVINITRMTIPEKIYPIRKRSSVRIQVNGASIIIVIDP